MSQYYPSKNEHPRTRRKFSAALLVACSLAFNSHGQGTFGNLGFESASVPSVPPDQPLFISAGPALPGWTPYVGTNLVSQILYNGISIGGPLVSLVDRHTAYYSNDVISGTFTASLDAGYNPQDKTTESAAIAQSGTVSNTARSLLFSASGNVAQLLVTFDGQTLPLLLLSNGSNFQVYGADISDFAGTSGELRFTEQPIPSLVFPIAFLDKIQFSSLPIPEPSVLLLSGIGALLFLLRRRGKLNWVPGSG